MNQQRDLPVGQQLGHFAGLGSRIGADADIERLALLDRRSQGTGRFLQRRVLIETVRIEDVDVIQPQALEALVQAGQDVFARAATLAIGAGPHVPAGLAGDDELVAVGGEVFTQQPTEIDLGAAVRRTVIVGQVEVIDAQVEGGAQQGALAIQRRGVAKVVPQTQGQRRQYETAAADAAVRNTVITIGCGLISHLKLLGMK